MKKFFVFFINIQLSLQLLKNETQLVFSIYRKDIHIVNLEKLKSTINYNETEILVKTADPISYIGEINYNLRANILIWRKSNPENAFYMRPIDKSQKNLLAIKDTKLLLKVNTSTSIRVSIDWIHNLLYYDENHKIIVFNISNPEYGFIAISNTFNSVLDLTVNPLDSLIFWSVYDHNNNIGKIMRSAEDGSHQRVLVDRDVLDPRALAIDFVMKRLFWIDRLLFKFSSIDFEGNHLTIITTSQELFALSYFMEIFGDNIYWSNYFHSSILTTNKFGLNGTQIHYLVKSETDAEIESLKIIDFTLQPNSINRCIYSKCSHLCLPISPNQYRCVCPQLKYSTNQNRDQCRESIHIIPNITTEDDYPKTTRESMTTLSFSTQVFEQNSKSETTTSTEELLISTISESINSEILNTSETITVRNEMPNDCNVSNGSIRFQKSFYVKNYKTSNVLYISLFLSLIINIFLSFVFVLKMYRRRKSLKNNRIRAQRCLAEFKPIQFEMNHNVYNPLIQSNPLISNKVFVRNNFL